MKKEHPKNTPAGIKKKSKELINWVVGNAEAQKEVWTKVGGIPANVQVQKQLIASDPEYKRLHALYHQIAKYDEPPFTVTRNGDKVTKGQVLVELDKEALQAAVRESKASLLAAEAAQEASEASYERDKVQAEAPELPFLKHV